MDEHFTIVGKTLEYNGDRPQTLAEAFEISIAKWEALRDRSANGEYTFDGGIETCGLCMRFHAIWRWRCDNTDDGIAMCGACPIAQISGEGCVNTPYIAYHKHLDEIADGEADPDCEKLKALCEEELELLRQLRVQFCIEEEQP